MSRIAEALRLWGPPIATMAVVSVSLSISVPLFALLLDRSGASATEVGINHTIAAVAMVLTAMVLPGILARTGVVPLMLASIALVALSMLAIPLWDSAIWWGFLRFGWGVAGTALFFASEFWLVSVTPEETRGRIVGLYVLILSGSYMIGPLLLNLVGIDGWLLYGLTTVIILVAAFPVLLGHRQAPPSRTEERQPASRQLRFYVTDPVIMWGVTLFGVIEFGALGLVTVWGLSSGFDQETSVTFVFWLAAGSMAFQLPVGWAADRFDRRTLLGIAGGISVLMPLMILAFGTSSAAISASAFIWGGAAVSFYSLALTELGSRYKGADLAAANAGVMLAYGMGALIGPLGFGSAMDWVGPNGLLYLAAGIGACYVVLVVLRMILRPRQRAE